MNATLTDDVHPRDRWCIVARDARLPRNTLDALQGLLKPMEQWFATGARPVSLLFSNLHAMALEGWARRHLVLTFALAVVVLGAALVWPWVVALPSVLAGYLLGLGLWPHVARHLSRRLGLRALVIVPTSRAWLARLLKPAGVELAALEGATFDLHVDTHVWHADVEAFGSALERDCERLATLRSEGRFGAGVVFVVNTFNRRLLNAVEQRLGPAQRRRGVVLQRESADAHTAAFLKRVQLKMFGREKVDERGREDVRAWDVVVATSAEKFASNGS